ncbi:MAG: glycoside hydrolase [Planctomycetes bacterium]|nr:glycoside hydrolase [Planctomycetota bacterium]
MGTASQDLRSVRNTVTLVLILLCLGWSARPCGAGGRAAAENAVLSVSLDPGAGTLSVVDKRTGQRWQQQALAQGKTSDVVCRGRTIGATWQDARTGLRVQMSLDVDESRPEFTVALSAPGNMKSSLRYLHPFVTETGTYLIVPMNEGISYPVEDAAVETRKLIAYGGHGICMPFWGVTDGRCGHMAIIETPDDASIWITRLDKKLCVVPEWDPQMGAFGYARQLRYVFFDRGGHVAMCKRYRAYAQEAGLFKTLQEKRRENPDVDLLIGAVNVWYWEKDAFAMLRELQAKGIDRILWSNRQNPDVIQAMNQTRGVLTSRYDIYQDLMDPNIVKTQLRSVHSDWTQDAWPDDIMLDEKGDWRKGWQVRGKDGQMYPCAVLCDKQALKYAAQRVPAELKTHPYRCRFIDTTTASPWRECYDPDHLMTRSDSRHGKMELLRYMSQDMHLVTGSETGHDAAVPFVHYFEGMLSLGPYRVPDAGRQMQKIWDEVPERVAQFQLGHQYRLPLWELVYHDCVVAQWYWGDYNNKLPALWTKRDLFNSLYGTPPMFMFTRAFWEQNQDRFARSYRDTCTVARAVGYAEMTDHRFLTPDRSVQQTSFANNVVVTVNFGDKPFRLPDGTELAPLSQRVTGNVEP